MGNDKLYHQVGGGEQIMFGYKIKIYEELGLLREILQ
jgi:hypothetical protein